MLAALALPGQALAATLTVPGQHATVEAAVAASAPGDTIRISAGTWDTEVAVTHSLTFDSAGDGEVTLVNTLGTSGSVISANGAATLTLRNLNFGPSANNRAVRAQGVIALIVDRVSADGLTTPGDGAFLEAVNVQVITIDEFEGTGGSAANGGQIAVRSAAGTGVLTLTDSTLVGGDATADGGILFASGTNVTVRDTVFEDGTASRGGGLWVDSAVVRDVDLLRVAVSDCVASEVGGGLFAHGVGVEISESVWTGNLAGSGGGAWIDQGASTEVVRIDTSSVFTGNSALGGGSSAEGALGEGGALRVVADDTSITNTDVDASDAVRGAVWLGGRAASVADVTFEGNGASSHAGGLAAELTGGLLVDRAGFTTNSSAANGGALWVDAPDLLVRDSTFDQNDATGDGGAVWSRTNNTEVQSTRFADGDAFRGGALFQETVGGELHLTGSTFFRNLASDGGAVYSGDLLALESVRNLWCENVVTNAGGALRATGAAGGNATLLNDGAASNEALTGGVYRLAGFDAIDLRFGSFAGNSGGVANVSGATTTQLGFVAATGTTGTAFIGTGTLTADRLALSGNTADLGGDWTSVTPTNPLGLVVTPVFNNFPATTCEDLRLYPRPTSELIDAGPGTDDLDGSATDVGLSGGAPPTRRCSRTLTATPSIACSTATTPTPPAVPTPPTSATAWTTTATARSTRIPRLSGTTTSTTTGSAPAAPGPPSAPSPPPTRPTTTTTATTPTPT